MGIVVANQRVHVVTMRTSSSKRLLQDSSRDLTSPPPPPKRRRAVTDAERKALRDFYFDPQNNKPPHKQLRQWFETQFHHYPSQSTISESLFSKYARLDKDTSSLSEAKRQRDAFWPDLEDALFDWQQQMMRKNATITGDILREMAAIFWTKLSQYAGQESPRFSVGWLTGFKYRHQIKKYRRHGEARAVSQEVKEFE